jgi:hypothetical protein
MGQPLTYTLLTAQITSQVLSHIAEVKTLDGLEKCHKYALFLKHASAGEANAIFWSLFIFDIVLLAIASLLWSSQDKHHRYVFSSSFDHCTFPAKI